MDELELVELFCGGLSRSESPALELERDELFLSESTPQLLAVVESLLSGSGAMIIIF